MKFRRRHLHRTQAPRECRFKPGKEEKPNALHQRLDEAAKKNRLAPNQVRGESMYLLNRRAGLLRECP